MGQGPRAKGKTKEKENHYADESVWPTHSLVNAANYSFVPVRHWFVPCHVIFLIRYTFLYFYIFIDFMIFFNSLPVLPLELIMLVLSVENKTPPI